MDMDIAGLSKKVQPQLIKLKQEFSDELDSIINWWLANVVQGEGFVGEVSQAGLANRNANKGVILATRLLWFFSEAAIATDRHDCKAAAEKIYRFICTHFIDHEEGGVFWELDARGSLINGRKQLYAQAFAVYAFSASYRLTGSQESISLAYELFELIEKYGLDRVNGGYIEAFSQHWGELDDYRLSEKDLNSPKTMNTHLHILEAYTGLYQADKSPMVKHALNGLIHCYKQKFIVPSLGHLKMFLSIDWHNESEVYSYGHDIESSWLLWEAIELIADKSLAEKYRESVLSLVYSCQREALAADGSLYDEFFISQQKLHKERIWWAQAEAMVGWLNAFEMTGDLEYIEKLEKVWAFVQRDIIDQKNGDWFWFAKPDQTNAEEHYKAGFWKGPYHNGRAMMELQRRIAKLTLRAN